MQTAMYIRRLAIFFFEIFRSSLPRKRVCPDSRILPDLLRKLSAIRRYGMKKLFIGIALGTAVGLVLSEAPAVQKLMEKGKKKIDKMSK